MSKLVFGEGEPQLDMDLYMSTLTLEPTTNAHDCTETSTAFAHN